MRFAEAPVVQVGADVSRGRLAALYGRVAGWYDLLDAPWERRYRLWRPRILKDVAGPVLEAGVGTGRNLRWYPPGAEVLGVDLSPEMLARARRRASGARAKVTLQQADATRLEGVPAASFDWYVATFLYCVLPDELQPAALAQMARVLKPGGRFRLVEIVWSNDPHRRRRQALLAPLVERLYGARFDRRTREHVRATPGLELTAESFLESDTYLLIEGWRAS